MTDDSTDEIDHANSAKMVVTIGGFNRNKKKSRLRGDRVEKSPRKVNQVFVTIEKYCRSIIHRSY